MLIVHPESASMRNRTNPLKPKGIAETDRDYGRRLVVGIGNAEEAPPALSLFDGKTLDGWIQIENSATSLAAAASPIRRHSPPNLRRRPTRCRYSCAAVCRIR